jgi:hypothetical protein
MDSTGNVVELESHIVHKLVENVELTDEEALGVAQWLLWLQLNGDDLMDVEHHEHRCSVCQRSIASGEAAHHECTAQNTRVPGRKRLKLSERRSTAAQLAIR